MRRLNTRLPDIRTLIGCLCIFLSAFFFYLATVIVKWATLKELGIDPGFFAFSRFILGFFTVSSLLLIRGQKVMVKRGHYLIGRALANCVAVFCFFKAVTVTSVAEANILNMTYPLFIALISWTILRQQRDRLSLIIVCTAFAGVWMILSPEKFSLRVESLWGLCSGISAAVGIIYLNLSRQVHDTQTTLFFLFGIGSVVMMLVFHNRIYWPSFPEFTYLFSCSFVSILGQYLITTGFKYVTAIEGGIISSTRILLAALLGPYIAMDPPLTTSGWIGAILIFGANVVLTMRKASEKQDL